MIAEYAPAVTQAAEVPQAGELRPFRREFDAQTDASLNLVGKVVVQSDLLDHGLHRLNVFDRFLAAFQ